jgi:hypothetical protein
MTEDYVVDSLPPPRHPQSDRSVLATPPAGSAATGVTAFLQTMMNPILTGWEDKTHGDIELIFNGENLDGESRYSMDSSKSLDRW